MRCFFVRCFILLPLLSSFIISHGQPNASFFQNFEIANHEIYVLHADGILKIFDENGKLSDTYAPKNKIKQLVKDHNGSIIIVDSTNVVKRLNHDHQWSTITSFPQGTIYGLGFNSANDCFLVTNKGVLDIKTQKLYFPEKKLFHSELASRGNNGWESEENGIINVYTDKDNNVWFRFEHGEWGDDMFVWNTKTFNFIPYSRYLTVPFYEINNHLFAWAGNFFEQYILELDKVHDQNKNIIDYTVSKVYSTENDVTYQKAKDSHNKPHPGIKSLSEIDWYNFYVGGFTYRPSDGKFYLITSEGLLTVDHLSRETKFSDLRRIKTFVFPKEITKAYIYYDHEKHEINFKNGYPQTATKIQFDSKNDLIMLAPSCGVWLFDGKQLKIIE